MEGETEERGRMHKHLGTTLHGREDYSQQHNTGGDTTGLRVSDA